MNTNTCRNGGLRLSWRSCLWLVFLGMTAASIGAQPNTGNRNNQETPPSKALGLEECIDLGLTYQPALAAAQSSLDSAAIGRRSLNRLGKFAELLRKDLPIRRQQADIGIVITTAGLEQAYWETRYAVARNFFSVQYARMQNQVAEQALTRLELVREALKPEEGSKPGLEYKKVNINYELVKARKLEASNGIRKATAALREAIGVPEDYPLHIAVMPLPGLVEKLDRDELIAMALERRGELVQAVNANQLTCLEMVAQDRLKGLRALTFAAGADIHARPIPTGIFNDIYRPGALGLEMPTQLVGKRPDRYDRASALHQRSQAVVDKTQNLVVLEVDIAFAKWQEASEKTKILADTPKSAEEVVELTKERYTRKKATAEEFMFTNLWEMQAKLQYNEAVYNHALALAALERVTAGGYPLPSLPGPRPGNNHKELP